MIRYTLSCENDHQFESWFAGAEAFDKLLAAGQISCALCGSGKVKKSLMAPGVQTRGEPSRTLATPTSEIEAAFRKMRKHVEENSEYVGMSFAKEARAIHDGNAPERPIYGEARSDEAKKLLEDGIPVAPLPFIPKSKTN